MPRNLPGTIKREAPPGPEMTEAQFKAAMETLTHDAARWRCLMLNWSSILEDLMNEREPIMGSDLRRMVDTRRGTLSKPSR